MTYEATVYEHRKVVFTVEAESDEEAVKTAEDAYANSEYLQAIMLDDASVYDDSVTVRKLKAL